MNVTIEFINAKFNEFNASVFASELPGVPVKLSHAKSFMGKLQFRKERRLFHITPRYTDFIMRFSTMYDLPENEWEDVILHEMIHFCIAVKGIRDTSAHGRVFRQYMKDINTRFGRNIRISYRLLPNPIR